MRGPTVPEEPARTGWRADPTGRFERRFLVAGRWTARVRVGTSEAVDALGTPDGPVPPAPQLPEDATGSDAGWRPDPTQRFDERWWDGSGWTRHVRHGDASATETTPAPLVARGDRGGGGDAPGWRQDPDGPGQRYHDGHDWTAKRRSGPPARAPSRATLSWWSRRALAATAVALVVVVVVVVAVLT